MYDSSCNVQIIELGIQVKIPDDEAKNATGNGGEEEKKETGAGDASPNPNEASTAEKKEHAHKEGWCIHFCINPFSSSWIIFL